MYRYMLSLVIPLILFVSCNKPSDLDIQDSDDVHVEAKHKNIILMIGDGMGLSQITAARTVNNDYLNIFRCQYIGIQSTHSADKYVTDSGASSTAMSTGEKVNFYTVGVDINNQPLTTILEKAESLSLSTALITTSSITHATPAAFFAHQPDRFAYENIALELIGKGVDFFLGGGRKYFDQRTDGLNLIDSLLAENYQVVEDLSQISGDKKVAAFIAEEHPPSILDGRGDVLSNAVEVCLSRIKNNDKGFFVMVEGAQIDWAGEENDQEYLIAEMLDFDKAVGKAIDFAKADGNTLVIVTGDHETGGYSLMDGDVTENTVEGEFLSWLSYGNDGSSFCLWTWQQKILLEYMRTQPYTSNVLTFMGGKLKLQSCNSIQSFNIF